MLKQVSASGAIVSKGGFPDPAGAQWQLNSVPPFTVFNSLLEICFRY